MPKRPPRITVVETLYHQPVDGQPTSVSSRFTRDLASDEQVYARKTAAGKGWCALDCGWVERASSVAVKNEEAQGSGLAVTVGTTQSAGGYAPFASILPGESLRLHPVDVGALGLMCATGQAKITVHVTPE